MKHSTYISLGKVHHRKRRRGEVIWFGALVTLENLSFLVHSLIFALFPFSGLFQKGNPVKLKCKGMKRMRSKYDINVGSVIIWASALELPGHQGKKGERDNAPSHYHRDALWLFRGDLIFLGIKFLEEKKTHLGSDIRYIRVLWWI